MNKSYSPANIPTFYDGENMEEVRTKTINPLTQEVTRLGVKVNDISLTSSSHANKIAYLESNGVDLTPLTNRVIRVEQEAENLDIRTDILETDKLDMQVAIGGIDTRVAAIEAGGGGGGTGGSTTFRGLTDTPAALEADKYVKVNSAGTALEFVAGSAGGGSGASAFTELSDTPSSLVANGFVKVNAAGTALEYKDERFLTDQSYINNINVYGDFTLGSNHQFSATQVANSGVVVYSSTSTGTVNMPTIVAKAAMPTSTQVRSGRSITIISLTNPVLVKAPVGTTQKLWVDGVASDEYTLEAGENITFFALYNSGFVHYIVTSGRKRNATP